MEELEWYEGQPREEDDGRRSEQGRRLEQKQVKCGGVPKRRKTSKIVVCGLHIPVGEIECAGDDNDDPGG